MVDSHPFRSMLIGLPMPEKRLFQTPTLKLKGQGRGWDRKAWSYSRPSILLSSFLLYINQNTNSWDTAISKFDLETTKVKVMREVKCEVNFAKLSNLMARIIKLYLFSSIIPFDDTTVYRWFKYRLIVYSVFSYGFGQCWFIFNMTFTNKFPFEFE